MPVQRQRRQVFSEQRLRLGMRLGMQGLIRQRVERIRTGLVIGLRCCNRRRSSRPSRENTPGKVPGFHW